MIDKKKTKREIRIDQKRGTNNIETFKTQAPGTSGAEFLKQRR